MDKKVLNILFVIATIGFITAGGIFLFICIFDGNKTSTPFNIALVCILLSNLFNVLRQMSNKKE